MAVWGTLLRETRSGLTTDFILDEQAALPRVLAAIRSDGQEELSAYGPEGLHAQRTITGTLDSTSSALLDAQGSLKHLTDSTGTLTLTRVYDAWGTLRFTMGSATSRLGYTGELQDGSLVYLRARWYHTGLGTFTSRDTFQGTPERSASLHRYVYTEGNPVNYSDPSGMCRPEQLGWFGEQGCTWFWETPQGFDPLQAKQDYVNWYWHIFQNIGLPGAIAGDIINTLSGHPTNMAEEIIQQDALAAVIGGLGRDFATGGTGRLPQLGTFIAGWSYANGLQRMICGTPVDPLGFAANTLVLVVGIKGGPTNVTIPSIPLGIKTIGGPGGSAALSVVASQAYAISIPTAQLAGAVAGQPGVLVLMADEGRGTGGGGGKDDIPWSNPKVRRAAKELQNGAINVYVKSREEAEEIFLRLYQGEGYQNTTGMSGPEVKDFLGGKAKTYHWDDQIDADGYLINHAIHNPDAQFRHLQVHTDDQVIRIFFGNQLPSP